jgi:hypothetical protein
MSDLLQNISFFLTHQVQKAHMSIVIAKLSNIVQCILNLQQVFNTACEFIAIIVSIKNLLINSRRIGLTTIVQYKRESV